MQIPAHRILILSLGILLGLSVSNQLRAENVWLTDLPPVLIGRYKVDPYLKAAVHLQQMGQRAATERLLGLAWDAGNSNESYENQQRIAVLCRMLFKHRPDSTFHRAELGAAGFYGENDPYGSTSYTNWPNEPIELVDGIPFAVVEMYGRGFSQQPHYAYSYLRYCLTNCDWSDFHYTLKSDVEKQEALKKLIASPKWRRPLTPSDQKWLSQQIQ